MADFITCPSCQRRLKMPAITEAAWSTCPACLAKIQNPTAQITAMPTSLAGVPAVPSASAGLDSLDREIQRDMSGTGYALITLSILGCLGYGLLIWHYIYMSVASSSSSSWMRAEGEREDRIVGWATLVLPVLTFVTMLYVRIFLKDPKKTGRRLGVIAVVGIGFLAILSVFIIFFVGCSAAFLSGAMR